MDKSINNAGIVKPKPKPSVRQECLDSDLPNNQQRQYGQPSHTSSNETADFPKKNQQQQNGQPSHTPSNETADVPNKNQQRENGQPSHNPKNGTAAFPKKNQQQQYRQYSDTPKNETADLPKKNQQRQNGQPSHTSRNETADLPKKNQQRENGQPSHNPKNGLAAFPKKNQQHQYRQYSDTLKNEELPKKNYRRQYVKSSSVLFNDELNKNWDALKKEINETANHIKKEKAVRSPKHQQQALRNETANLPKNQQQYGQFPFGNPTKSRQPKHNKVMATIPSAEEGGDRKHTYKSPADEEQRRRKSPDEKHRRRRSPYDDHRRPKLNAVVGVVLTMQEEMVVFFVYHFKQRKFSHVVKVSRTKFPDSCQSGVWFRLLFPDEFDVVEHFRVLVPDDGEDYATVVPRKVVSCQRRLSTRIRDEKVMFFVTATYKRHCPVRDVFLYKCRLGMLTLTREQLNDGADENSNGTSSTTTSTATTTTSSNENGQQEQQQLDEMPQRLKMWIWPSGAGDLTADGYYRVARIDARIWVSNDPDSDSDTSSVNGGDNITNFALSSDYAKWFDELVDVYYQANRLTDQRRQFIEKFVVDLQQGLRTETGTDLEVKLFGSILSGFGSNDCDIDLCLIDTGIAKYENEEGVIPQERRREWITTLVRFLRRSEQYTVISVADARTPIVKFEHHGDDGFHGDISVENGLALHNTELLRLYSCFDDRVSPLGFAVKRWAKLNGINDASAGSISSYAYIVMLIHFLQRVEPPVLPFLQNEKTGLRVEGWHVSFEHQLPKQFPNKNTLSVAQLFYDFLFYYAYKFDVHTDVAQIRTTKQYNKKDRGGESSRFRLCVEDPFDLHHNLTSGAREDTLQYILKCFRSAIRGLEQFDGKHFATPKEEQTGDDGANVKQPPKINFDQLLRPFKPRRVVHINSNNNNNHSNGATKAQQPNNE